jgi:hypothetical protein
MALVHGKVLTKDQARALGVFDIAEALVPQGKDKPLEAIMPADVPIEQTGSGKNMDGKAAIGTILSSIGSGGGILDGIGKVLSNKPEEKTPNLATSDLAKPNSFKDGGKVQKTGMALVHEGETVTPAKPHTSLYRAMHHLRKGGLHRALHVPEDQPIPQDKLQSAKDSSNTHIRHMANFAEVMGHFKH